MCIINVKDLSSLLNKTLIYFTSNPLNCKILPGSYICLVPESISQFIQELRKLNITSFPIICYDNEEMRLASTAF